MKKNTEHGPRPTASYVERIRFLREHIIFSLLDLPILESLAERLQDVTYHEGLRIDLHEPYIEVILNGSAILYQAEPSGSDLHEMRQLNAEDILGLEKSAYFSDIKAEGSIAVVKSDLKVMRISIIEFDKIITDHKNAPSLAAAQRRFLQVYMIKQAKPFSRLTHQKLKNIITHVEELYLPAGEVLLYQNEPADFSYLLYEGNLEVSIMNAEKQKRILSEITPVNLFGESALTENSRRNATVKAVTDCKILRIKNQFFYGLTIDDIETYKNIFNLIASRSRPLAYPNVTVHPRLLADNSEVFILKNQELNSYYQLNDNQLFIWNLLDGEHTISDIALAYKAKYEEISLDDISSLVVELAQSDFIKSPKLKSYADNAPKPFWVKSLLLFKKIMECELAFKNIDPAVTALYNAGGFLLYKKFTQLILAVLSVIGCFAFLAFVKQAEVLLVMPNSGLLYAYLIPASFVTILIHELSHALTTKYFGHTVTHGGIGWYWVTPIAFVDTSDMWLSTRMPRLWVNLAGIYSSIIIAGIAALSAWLVSSPMLALFLWLYSLYSYLCAIYNCDPIIELDGYYILMDLFDEPNLRQEATFWLMGDSLKTLKSMTLIRQHYKEIIYWISCIGYLSLSIFLTFAVQFFILKKALPITIFHIPTIYLQWIFSITIIAVSFITIYATIKAQSLTDK